MAGARQGRPGAATVFGRGERLLLLLGFAVLAALRLPRAWMHGRFLDEEATVFLAYAWHHPWWDALFRPFAGYWNLGATAPTVLAAALVKGGALPLERAPYLTMTVALLAELLPAVLILTGRSAWLGARAAVIAALLIVATAPGTEEVALNVLHIQLHLALCAGLILALDVPARRGVAVGYGVLLFLAPLCGPGAIVILPLFALRALLDRDPGRAAQLAAFAGGAAVQLIGFYGPSPMRGHLLDPATVGAMMAVRLIALPLLNYGSADAIGAAVHASQIGGGIGWWAAVAASVVGFGAFASAAARRRDAAVWLLLGGLAIGAASFGFGMVVIYRFDLFSVGSGERYDFLPQVLIGFAAIVLAMRGGRARRVWASLVALMLLSGAIRYPFPSPGFADGPAWPAEVAKWRRNHAHPLAVWPKPWAADLSDTTRACSPPGPDVTRSSDPRWCESGWAADFYRARPVGRDTATVGSGR